MSLSEYQIKIIDNVADCSAMGLNYYHSEAWHALKLAVSPALFFSLAREKNGEDILLEMVENHNNVADYMSLLAKKHGMNSEEYRSCFVDDFVHGKRLNYTKVLEAARSWARAGERSSEGQLSPQKNQ